MRWSAEGSDSPKRTAGVKAVGHEVAETVRVPRSPTALRVGGQEFSKARRQNQAREPGIDVGSEPSAGRSGRARHVGRRFFQTHH